VTFCTIEVFTFLFAVLNYFVLVLGHLFEVVFNPLCPVRYSVYYHTVFTFALSVPNKPSVSVSR